MNSSLVVIGIWMTLLIVVPAVAIYWHDSTSPNNPHRRTYKGH